MKIVSWNVNGIRAVRKKGFLEFVGAQKPDLLCLQETKGHPDQVEKDLLSPDGMQGAWTPAWRKGYSGTATFFREAPLGIEHGIGIRKFDTEGRFVVTRHPRFKLYNVYFPNGSSGQDRHGFKQEFLERFTQHLQRDLAQKTPVIVLGDYNVAPCDIDVYDPVGLASVSGFLPEERAWFERFQSLGFTDSFRHFHPDRKGAYTWWSYLEGGRINHRGWRIDHICVSPELKSRLKNCEILDAQEGSDHCPIYVELEV